jgi:hypothetical protein
MENTRQDKCKPEIWRTNTPENPADIFYHLPNTLPIARRDPSQNKDRSRSLSDLIVLPRAPTSIKYRLQSHSSLLRVDLRSAYLVVLCFSAHLASVSQGQVSSTKAILCLPCTNQSMMIRFGLCDCTMRSAGIDLPSGACSPSKSQHSSTILLPTRADFRQPAM